MPKLREGLLREVKIFINININDGGHVFRKLLSVKSSNRSPFFPEEKCKVAIALMICYIISDLFVTKQKYENKNITIHITFSLTERILLTN